MTKAEFVAAVAAETVDAFITVTHYCPVNFECTRVTS